MSDDPTYVEAIKIVVDEARQLIQDGAAEVLTMEDLHRAEKAQAGSRAPENIAALAEVVALGVEYLSGVEREQTAVNQVGPRPEMAAASVRHFYSKGLVR
jgi:hypothetical protein